MLKRITFKEDHECFLKGQIFEFGKITLLVGDQGCGKSTMLRLIQNNDKGSDFFDLYGSNSNITDTLHFDSERHNPRVNALDTNNPDKYRYGLLSHFRSHGETLRPILNLIAEEKNTLILLDEPESGLSIRSQFALVGLFKQAIDNGNQLVISTHSNILMEAFPDSILSLEHNKHMPYEEFINSQRVLSDFMDVRQDALIKKEKCNMGLLCTCVKDKGRYKRSCENRIK